MTVQGGVEAIPYVASVSAGVWAKCPVLHPAPARSRECHVRYPFFHLSHLERSTSCMRVDQVRAGDFVPQPTWTGPMRHRWKQLYLGQHRPLQQLWPVPRKPHRVSCGLLFPPQPASSAYLYLSSLMTGSCRGLWLAHDLSTFSSYQTFQAFF